MINIKPRIENITEFIKVEEIKNMKPEDKVDLPEEILNKVGDIKNVSYPQQGMCSLVMIIESELGKFLLKIAKGEYRGKELYAEYLAMKSLKNADVPVPKVYDFFQKEEFYYLLRECSNGTPLNKLFFTTEDKEERLYMIREMAKELTKIHNIKINHYPYDKVINDQLYFAETHFNNKTIDIYDFEVDGEMIDPKTELEWLKENKSLNGQATLIHGDYRPKNFLWYDGKITSILDWAFCDIGDPYYDIAILFYYFKDEDEKRAFIEAYGIEELDQERLEYQTRMIPFINI
ncbi:phosphotransferase [Oceanirhabdus sp. W0125-5]|uniref:phosphotransferase n=1 Tax=Oceanirhabdus sp. W0125-5 TaxID=2999116 RepID=UPI0022F2A628|nr:phosphotransferase [Oceanirhabdus sp. W0125-5]WBW98626.1 phosphotransferase [Oceanirhabdus sp. W0125-5]